MRYSLAVVLGALALSACTDQIDRSPTSPFSPRFSFTLLDGTERAAFEETIRDGIRCLIVDPIQEQRKISDFDKTVVKADKGEVQAVTDFVNNFVKWADDYLSGKKTPPFDDAECGGRELTLEQAKLELYNLLYWYSGQYAKISAVDYGPGVDAGSVVCYPNLPCELDGDNAFIRAPEGTFNYPTVVGFRPLDEGDLPADFNQVGTPVPPYYEFYTIPEGVIANGDGWGRFICIPHDDFVEGGGELYKLTDGDLELILGDGTQILCEPPSTSSNSLLGRLQQFASRITAPVRPRVLYATGHRAIGGPSTTASPHAVVQSEGVAEFSCETFDGWSGDANELTWDFKAGNYPFTSLVSISIRLSTANGVSVRARRFSPGGGGEKDLGFGTAGDPVQVGEDGYDVTFTWPTQPVNPSGSVEFDVSSTSGTVEYGLSGAENCVLTTISGGLGVTGSLSGHSSGGGDEEPILD